MIKMKKIFIPILFAAAILAGCNEPATVPETEGSFTIEVDGLSDRYITKSDVTLDVNDFDYFIDGEFRDYSGKIGEMNPVFENVPEGKYTITVSSAGKKAAAFDQPVIFGTEEFEVKAGEITSVLVVCSIQNVKVTIHPTDEFFTEFATYTITVSNGDSAENKLIWTNEELLGANYASLTKDNVLEAKSGYFTVGSALEFYVTGYRAATDQEAVYEGVISPIAAKDHYIIRLHAQTTGQLGSSATPGVALKVDYTTNDIDVNDAFVPGFELPPVEGPDDPSAGDGDDNGDDEEEEELIGLSLEWPANPEFDVYELKPSYEEGVVLTVYADNHISGFLVKISSPLDAFMDLILGMIGGVREGDYIILDLMDPEIADKLGSLGLPTGSNLLNRSEILFDISNLVPLICDIGPEPGTEHIFVMEVTDTKGQVLSQELVFRYFGAN